MSEEADGSGAPMVSMCHGAPPPSEAKRVKRDEAAAADKAPPKEDGYILKSGDLLRASEQFICHQCNCITKYPKGKSEG
jgi:hypothetical protein